MTGEDWVRFFNLIGCLVLFYGSLRGQLWTRKQAKIVNRAAPEVTSAPPATDGGARPAAHKRLFTLVAARNAARPWFDSTAYLVLCFGFGISAISAGLDMHIHGTFEHLIGRHSTTGSESCARKVDLQHPCATAE